MTIALEEVRRLADGTLDHNTLPDTTDARLPATYEAIKTALVECERVDECKSWADRAAALAAYARMRDDRALLRMAQRVQDWATRRVGELLEQVKPAANRHDVSSGALEGPGNSVGRLQAGRDAGLSDKQIKTAIRVARVPDAEFSQQVESDDPPTVSELAGQGTRKVGNKEAALRAMREAQAEPAKPTAKAEYDAAVQLVGMVDDLVREAKTIDLAAADRGLVEGERRHLADLVDQAAEWLAVVATRMNLNVVH